MFAPKDGNCFHFLAVLGPDIIHTLSKRNSDDQLKTIREEKHKEYLHNTGRKYLSWENNKNNENSKQFNKQK